MWKLTEKELIKMRGENPNLYKQIFPNEEITKEVNLDNKSALRLAKVDYANDWALQHPILAQGIRLLLDLGGYDESTLERNK